MRAYAPNIHAAVNGQVQFKPERRADPKRVETTLRRHRRRYRRTPRREPGYTDVGCRFAAVGKRPGI